MPINTAAPQQLPQILGELMSEYSLDRRDGSDGSSYGSSVDYTQDAATADLYLYQPSSSQQIATTGEQFEGVLSGICLPGEDIEVGDRLTWGDGRYEIISPIELKPTEIQTDFLQFSLDRVAQPDPSLIN
jgi:hypothetical protein